MKNEQQNNQNGKQDQKVKSAIPTEQDQQKKKDDWTNKSTGKNQPSTSSQSSGSQSQTLGNEKSNIGVDNEGKIGKAHDQWNNDNNNRNEQPNRTVNNNGNEQPNRNTSQQNIDQQKNNDQQKDNQLRSDKTVTEPEIAAPIYDPEKTEKKIPQMGSNK